MNYYTHLLVAYGPLWALLLLAIFGMSVTIEAALNDNKWFAVMLVPFIVFGAVAFAALFG